MPEQRPVNLEHILTHPDGALANIIQAYRHTKAIESAFKKLAPPEIAKHCRIGLFHKNALLLQVNSSAWAAKLRLHKADLLRALRQAPEFIGLARIDITIAATETKTKKVTTQSTKPKPIPKAAIEIARHWAQSTDDKELQQHLLKLIKDHDKLSSR